MIAADECYSEIYFDEATPPLGALAVAHALGPRRISASRRRSAASRSGRTRRAFAPGYVAGDAALIEAFLLYRTYHGSAMSPAVAAASIAAWSDEVHVRANRAEYAAKFAALQPRLARGASLRNARCRVLPLGADTDRRRRVRAATACRAGRDRASRKLSSPATRTGRTRAAAASGSRWSLPAAECAEAIDRIVAFAREPCSDAPGQPAGGLSSAPVRPVATASPSAARTLECGHGHPRRNPAHRAPARALLAAAFASPGSRVLLIAGDQHRRCRAALHRGHASVLAPVHHRSIRRSFDRLLRSTRLAPGASAHRCGGLLGAVAARHDDRPRAGARHQGLPDRRPEYRLGHLHGHGSPGQFIGTAISAFIMGLCVSLFFMLKFREAARAPQTLHRRKPSAAAVEARGRGRAQADAGAGRAALPVQHARLGAVPHRNRSAEGRSDARTPARISARRAAATALREHDARPGRSSSPRRISTILKCGWGPRLSISVDAAEELRSHAFPPVLLITLVENAVTHGIEPRAEGGRDPDRSASRRRPARRQRRRYGSAVCAGVSPRPGNGVGLANVRERLAALFGSRGRFSLVERKAAWRAGDDRDSVCRDLTRCSPLR